MQRIEILMFDGFDELDVVAPLEILASAGFTVDLVTIDERSNIGGAHGMPVHPQRVLGTVPDLLVVPGGGWASKAPRGAWVQVRRGVLPLAIAQRHAAGSQVAGVCTGAMLLAASGMLRGRPAVTHRCALDDLRQAGADVHAEARVVDDGDVLTCGGVTSAIDLALHIVARERGANAAAREGERLEHDFRGPVLKTSAAHSERP